MRKRVFGHRQKEKAQIRLHRQSDPGLHCPLTKLLDTAECMNGEQRSGWYFVSVHDDLNLHILCLFESTCIVFLYYCIQPNYRTVRFGFSKSLGKHVVKYVSTYTKGTLKQRSAKDLSNDAYAMFLCFLFLIFFRKAYVVDTHLNCIDKSMQFK